MGRVSRAIPIRIAFLGIVPLAIVALLWVSAIADKDSIVVATLNGEPITRGDLADVIRKMPDDVRPLIQNKGDLLRTLNKYIDDEIKTELAKQLKAEGKIQGNRNLARQNYFKKRPELLSVYQIHDPTAIPGMTEGDVVAVKAEIEFGVDDEEEILLREEALDYKVEEAAQARIVSVTEEEFSREFNMLKSALYKPEFVEFKAIQFPIAPGAVEEAAKARRRLDRGEAFDEVLAGYMEQHPRFGMRSVLENDPANAKYGQFWDVVSGCEVGQQFGPVFMPEREQTFEAKDGTTQFQPIPAVLLVLEVIDHSPEMPMTVDEARPMLTWSLLKRKVIELLRAERGAEVYPDKLPRPEGYGNQYKDQMIKTSV